MKNLAANLECIITLLLAVVFTYDASAELTLGYCLEKAEKNYPLVKKYGIMEKTSEISLSDINKSWLPRIGVYGQATLQNAVPEFPDPLQNMLSNIGQDFDGLGHLQYKVGIDLSQSIWDGGASKAQRGIERASISERQAALDVQLYSVREKVIDLYFGILLMEEQSAQTENTLALLQANHTTMQSMIKGGVAMQCDADMIEAQILSLSQQLTNAKNIAKSYRDILSIYIGEDLGDVSLVMPEAEIPVDSKSARPELRLFEAQSRLNSARHAAIQSTIMPTVGFFAQAYYGYPGLNYFESMRGRDLSFNILVGLKISWNIDSFYTKRNSQRKLHLAEEDISTDREQFLFNSSLQTSSETREIENLRHLIADDGRIVSLRASVRESAESQLRNGVIDATSLLSKITDENQARLNSRYHEVQLLYNIYKLKNTINR